MSCVRRRNQEPVDEQLCDPLREPIDTQSCGEEPCPPKWVEGEWSPCSKQCGSGGEQTRQIKCEQVVSGGIPSIVDDSQCLKLGPKPEPKQECNKGVDCPQWHTGPWKPVRKIFFIELDNYILYIIYIYIIYFIFSVIICVEKVNKQEKLLAIGKQMGKSKFWRT